MIRQTCSCGATFEADGYRSPEAEVAAGSAWLQDHRCVEPASLLTVETDSGPGLADVIDAIDRVSANVGLLNEIVIAYLKAQS